MNPSLRRVPPAEKPLEKLNTTIPVRATELEREAEAGGQAEREGGRDYTSARRGCSSSGVTFHPDLHFRRSRCATYTLGSLAHARYIRARLSAVLRLHRRRRRRRRQSWHLPTLRFFRCGCCSRLAAAKKIHLSNAAWLCGYRRDSPNQTFFFFLSRSRVQHTCGTFPPSRLYYF